MDNCILLSIRKNWAAAILSGEKRLEIRKCAPSYNPNTEKRAEYPLRVVMYETKAHGGAGAVVGFFDCPGYIGTADPADEVMAQLSGLSVEQLEECQAAARTARPGPVRIRRSREHQPCLPMRFLPLGPTPQAGRTCHAGTLVILQYTPRPVKSKSPGGRRPRNSHDKAARLRARGKNGPAKGR